MIVRSTLNNYQIGSYAHRVLEQKILNETRLDTCHIIVRRQLDTRSEYELLVKALDGYKNRVVVEKE